MRCQCVRKADAEAQPVFTYLANSIRVNGREIPYSVVTAMDRPELTSNDEIVLNDWSTSDLKAKPGDTVSLEYYVWDPSGRLVSKSASFRNAGSVAIEVGSGFLPRSTPASPTRPPFPIGIRPSP